MMGFVFIQTVSYNAVVCSSWRMDLTSYILDKFSRGLVIFGTTTHLDYFDSLEYFALISWLDWARWPDLVTLGWAVILSEVYFG